MTQAHPGEFRTDRQALFATYRYRRHGYRTAKNFIAIASLRLLSRLKNLPAHPFSAAAPVG
jgi:hypothetical protein